MWITTNIPILCVEDTGKPIIEAPTIQKAAPTRADNMVNIRTESAKHSCFAIFFCTASATDEPNVIAPVNWANDANRRDHRKVTALEAIVVAKEVDIALAPVPKD